MKKKKERLNGGCNCGAGCPMLGRLKVGESHNKNHLLNNEHVPGINSIKLYSKS